MDLFTAERQEPPCECAMVGCSNFVDSCDLFGRVGENNEKVVCLDCWRDFGAAD